MRGSAHVAAYGVGLLPSLLELDDPDNWRRTHRFGGACFMVVGVSLIVLGFLGGILPETWILAVIMVLAIGSVAAMYVYSYLIWRKSHNS